MMSSSAAEQQLRATTPWAAAKMVMLTRTMMSRAVQLHAATLLGSLLTLPVRDTDVCDELLRHEWPELSPDAAACHARL